MAEDWKMEISMESDGSSGPHGGGSVEAAASPREPKWMLGVYLVMVLALVAAFRAILVAPFGLSDPGEFEYWFFIPNRDSGAVSVFIAAWFLWNRRERLSELPPAEIGWIHWAVASLILPAFIWAVWVSAEALLIPVLCLTIAAIAWAWGGRAALAIVVMPCAAFMLAFPPPAPLQAEIIWRLQNITAGGSNLLLSLAGYAPQLEGTEIRLGNHAFVIIEACSGWRGIQVLSIVALAAGELRELSFRRTLWVVLAAIPLGIGLNVMRACLVMLTQEDLKAAFFESHTPQGIAVLVIGGVVLYALAMRLEDDARPDGGAESSSAGISSFDSRSLGRSRWIAFGLIVPLVLAGASVLIPIFHEGPQPPPHKRFGFRLAAGKWIGTELGLDYFFPYSTAANPQFHAEYRKPNLKGGEKLVDLFIGWETPKPSGLERMPNAKLLVPASDWTLISRESAIVWQFGFDAERAIVTRSDRSKFSYVIAWRVRDRGLFAESLLSLAGLPGCGESPNGCPRIVVRIVVPIFQYDADGRELAKETANEFIDDFILPLKILAVR